MNDVCNNYCNLINDQFKNIKTIIIYGSNIYNTSSSDLDICLIADECSNIEKLKIIKTTLDFHKKNALRVDEEIPHENKLIYLTSEIEEALSNPPFYSNDKIIIKDIVKSEEYLSSKEMKQRLLLNILTTDHMTIGENISDYEKKAMKIMIEVVKEFYNLSEPTPEEILSCFYTNKYTNASGEMYLGYKENYKQKEKYLLKKIKEVLYEND